MLAAVNVTSRVAVVIASIFLFSFFGAGQGSDAGDPPGEGRMSSSSWPLLDFHASSVSDDVMITYHNHENRTVAAWVLLDNISFVNAFGMYEVFHLDSMGDMLNQDLGGSPTMGRLLRVHHDNMSAEYGPLWREVYYDVTGANRKDLNMSLQLPPGKGFIVIGLDNTISDMRVFLEETATVAVEEINYDPDYLRWGTTLDRGDWDSMTGVGSWAASVHMAHVEIDVRYERHSVVLYGTGPLYTSEVSITTPDGRTCSSRWQMVAVIDNIPPGRFELKALSAADGDRPVFYSVRDFPAPVSWPEYPYRTECLPWNTQS